MLDLWVRAPAAARAAPARGAGVLSLEPVGGRAARTGSSACACSSSRARGCSTACSHAVRDGGADLHHVSLAQPSLEDVYIHLTGRELRE